MPQVVRLAHLRQSGRLDGGTPFALPPIPKVDMRPPRTGEDEPRIEAPRDEFERGLRATRDREAPPAPFRLRRLDLPVREGALDRQDPVGEVDVSPFEQPPTRRAADRNRRRRLREARRSGRASAARRSTSSGSSGSTSSRFGCGLLPASFAGLEESRRLKLTCAGRRNGPGRRDARSRQQLTRRLVSAIQCGLAQQLASQ